MVSHRVKVGTLTGTTTKDSVQTVRNSMTWVRIDLGVDLFSVSSVIINQLCVSILKLISTDCIFLSKGNYCPICFKCYEDNDYDSQMMQCGTCNHWVHAKCEDLTGEGKESRMNIQ